MPIGIEQYHIMRGSYAGIEQDHIMRCSYAKITLRGTAMSLCAADMTCLALKDTYFFFS